MGQRRGNHYGKGWKKGVKGTGSGILPHPLNNKLLEEKKQAFNHKGLFMSLVDWAGCPVT